MNEEVKRILLENIQCSICMEYTVDNLMQCYNGHSHCRECYKRLLTTNMSTRKRCSVCMSSKGWTHQRLWCQVLEQLNVSITCSNEGCKTRGSPKQMSFHSLSCSHKLYACPLNPMECENFKYDDLCKHVRNHGKRLCFDLLLDEKVNVSKYLNVIRSTIPDTAGRIMIVCSQDLFILDIIPADVRMKYLKRNAVVRMTRYGPKRTGLVPQVEFNIPDFAGNGWSRSVCDVVTSQNIFALDDSEQSYCLHMFPHQFYTTELIDKCWISCKPISKSDLRTFGINSDAGDDDDDALPLFSFSLRLIYQTSTE